MASIFSDADSGKCAVGHADFGLAAFLPNCAVLPYIPFVNFRQAEASSRRVLHDTMGQTDAMV